VYIYIILPNIYVRGVLMEEPGFKWHTCVNTKCQAQQQA